MRARGAQIGRRKARLRIMARPAILLLGFNRVDTLRRVIESVAQSGPGKVYFAADGPRDPARHPDDADACRAVRDLVMRFPWNCEVETLLRESNLGLGRAVSEAITWFFRREESGIILEDDCVPAPDFVPYCEELLGRYAGDERVFSIRGARYSPPGAPSDPSYSFSRHPDCHGWAAWRRSWHHFRFDIADWRARAGPRPLAQLGALSSHYWGRRFDAIASEVTPRNWASQWYLAHYLHDALTIVPRANLVSHVGAGPDATNCVRGFLWDGNPMGAVPQPLIPPRAVAADDGLDALHETWRHNHRPWPARKFWQLMNRWELGSLAWRRGGVGDSLP